MKMILATTTLAAASLAGAQVVDCPTLKMGSYIRLSYKEKATFPDVPKATDKFLKFDNVDIDQCGYTITGDTNKVYIKANSVSELLKLVAVENTSWFAIPMLKSSGYKYPSIREGFYLYPLYVVLNTKDNSVSNLKADNDYIAESTFRDSVIGYKLNNGALKPYYYDGKVIPFTIPPETSTLDFYAKKGDTVNDGWDRILFNFKDNSITLWYNYPFPQN